MYLICNHHRGTFAYLISEKFILALATIQTFIVCPAQLSFSPRVLVAATTLSHLVRMVFF